MFDLGPAERQWRILGCGDGPASFNAELTLAGGAVISCDPIYEFSSEQIQGRFEGCIDTVMAQVRAHPENYVWTFHRDPDDLLRTRRAAMMGFLADYPRGKASGRYVIGALPRLDFVTAQFDLALCSHLLFLYSHILPFEFHLETILELCRVAREARIFPLTDLSCALSPHLGEIELALRSRGFEVEVRTVDYQLQRNGNQMMRIFGGAK